MDQVECPTNDTTMLSTNPSAEQLTHCVLQVGLQIVHCNGPLSIVLCSGTGSTVRQLDHNTTQSQQSHC